MQNFCLVDDTSQCVRAFAAMSNGNSQPIHSCAIFAALDVGPHERRSQAMAEVIRIAESASEPTTQILPQNVEAEAALLGALMVDNRLVEDVQLKLKPHHFF